MATYWTRRLALFAAVSIAVLGGGCAEERPPINRVQANALAKSFFVGADLASPKDDPEYYMRPTIVDVGFGADGSGLFTSSYAQPVNRIKWEITEKLLVARLTHERIEDADHHGSAKTNTGNVVAAFAISGHFDIKRGYNAATGEETNVIEENTSDRPWSERKYFRVDWSANLVTDAYSLDMLSILGVDNGVSFTSLSYNVTIRERGCPRLRRRHRLLRRDEPGLRRSQDPRYAVREDPGLHVPRRVRRRHVPDRQLRSRRGEGPALLQAARRHRLRAEGLGLHPLQHVRRLLQRAPRLGRRVRRRRRQLAPPRIVLQPLAEEPRQEGGRQRHPLQHPRDDPARRRSNRDGDVDLGREANGTDDECEDQGAPPARIAIRSAASAPSPTPTASSARSSGTSVRPGRGALERDRRGHRRVGPLAPAGGPGRPAHGMPSDRRRFGEARRRGVVRRDLPDG